MSAYDYDPFDNRGGAPGRDVVSDDLQRRAVLVTAAVIGGLGVGVLTLLLAGPAGAGKFLLALVGGLVATAAVLRYPHHCLIGVLLLSWAALGTGAIAQGGSGGGAKRLYLSQVGPMLLISAWVLRSFLAGGRRELYRAPVVVPIFVYLALSTWSTVNGMLFPNEQVLLHGPKQFWQVNALEVLLRVLALGSVLLIANTLEGRLLKWAAWAVVVPGVVTFTGLLSFLPASSYLAFPQILAMAVLAAFAVDGGKRPWWVRALAGATALAIFGFYFLKGTEWVSGWFGGLVALAVVTFFGRRKLFWAGAAAVALLVVVNWGYFYQKVYSQNFYGSGPTRDAARRGQMGTFENDRTRMLRASVRYAGTFPLGIGLGNYRSYNKYFGRPEVWNTTTFTSAHGTYAQALSETGWPGLFALLLLLYASGRTLRQTQRALPPGWQKTYTLGAYGGVLGIFAASFNGDYLFPTYHNGGMGTFGACIYTWYMLGVCLAIARENGIDWDALAGREVAPAPRPVAPVYNRPDAGEAAG